VQELRGGDVPEPEGPVVGLGRDRLAIGGEGQVPFALIQVPFGPADQAARGHVEEGQMSVPAEPIGHGPATQGADQRPVGREGEVADLLHPRVDPAQLSPVSGIPDLEIIFLAIRHDEPTVRRIDDMVDLWELAEADRAQAHRGPGRQGIAVAIGPGRLG
jgi:hypothetical protein